MSPLLETARPSALSRGQLRALLVVGLLLAEIAVGAMSVNFTSPGTRISAYWPNAGISVIVLCLAAPRWRPALLPALYAVAVAANLLGDRPVDLALTLGVVNVLEPLAVLWVLTHGHEDPPALRNLADLPRLLLAALAGAVVAALIVGPAVAQLVDGDLGATMRAVLASHGAALLVLVPFAMRTVPLRRRCSRTEAVVQWTGLVVVSLLVFAPGQELPLAFLPFPLLAWGALRLSTREVTAQVLVYGALTGGLTTAGYGPLVRLVADVGAMPQVVGTLLQANLVAAALIALPLSLVRTQQVATVDRLTSQHDMVSNILASTTGNAILGTTMDATIEFFNVGAEAISGHRAEEVVGRAHLALAPDGSDRVRVRIAEGPAPTPNELAELVEAMLVEQPSFSADWDFIRVGGEARTVSVVVTHRLGDDGRPVGYLGVGVDVTEQRQQEAAMAAALEHEKQILERLAQVDQTKNDFLATVSHELRTPITSILGYSQLLLSDDTGTLPAMHHQIVGRIERNGKRLMGLIEDMLTMSQVEVGNLRFHRVPLDLREPVMRALEALQPALAHRNLVLDHDLGDEAVKILGDTDKLERAFANLVSNAVKFSHEGDTIVVRLATDGDEAVFRVTDTGLGISLEDQAHLFDRFFRSADAHALAIQGVGLGLPIAASIVAGHDGAIDVESTLGQGSTFVVRLQLLDEGHAT